MYNIERERERTVRTIPCLVVPALLSAHVRLWKVNPLIWAHLLIYEMKDSFKVSALS